MELNQVTLLQVYHPQILTPDVRIQLTKLLESPVLIQYFIEHAIHMLIQNGFDMNPKGASGEYIKGLNEGTLNLLNSILTKQVISGLINIHEEN